MAPRTEVLRLAAVDIPPEPQGDATRSETVEPNEMTDMPGQTAPKDRRSRASMTNNELAQIEREQVQEHIAEIMFDTHDGGDPDCLLCKRGVELGLWARYGYPDGPWCTCEIAADLGFSGYGDGVNPNTIVATRPDCPQHGVHGWEH